LSKREHHGVFAAITVGVALTVGAVALAQAPADTTSSNEPAPPGSVPDIPWVMTTPSASASSAPKKVLESCRENIPDGATRPTVTASVEPTRATSGHATWLVVAVQHGAGEQLLPEGFNLRGGSDAIEVLEESFWFAVDPAGPSATTITPPSDEERAKGERVTSVARIPFVPLPEHPGTNELTLPPVPIAVARANGQVMTVCTPNIKVTVDDPIANELEPAVRPNPPPRPQRERWESLVQTARLLAILLPFVIGAVAFLVWWLRRPKPVPPKPQIPPWVTAMQSLGDVRRTEWLADERFNEYFDRVDDVIRLYLGERYGFDGLESTSPEIRDALARVTPKIDKLSRVHKFLDESDFVKYAEVTPTREDCVRAMDRAEAIVKATMPPMPVPQKSPRSRRAA
jgi:hypothetical protein